MLNRQLLIASSLDHTAPEFYGGLIARADEVIAVDGGVWACHQADTAPALLVGDMDSADRDDIAWAQDLGVRRHTLPREKDESDLRVAIDVALTSPATLREATGVLGGRLDHELAALGAFFASEVQWVLTEPDTIAWVLPGPATLELEGTQSLFSTLGWGGKASVSISGARYPLEGRTLGHLDSLGISNVITDTRATVDVHSGSLLVVHPRLDSPPLLGYAVTAT